MNKTIFIADDDTDIVNLLSCRCKQLGFKVETARNATTALGVIEQCRPDAVILDVEMPSGNGLSVCEMMSSHEELRSIPVIILTGSTNEDTVRRCHQLCAYYVLKCPDVWSRIEPILQDLFDCNEAVAATNSVQETEEVPIACMTHNPMDLMDTVFAMLGTEEDNDQVGVKPHQFKQPSEQAWVLLIEDDNDFVTALQIRLEEYGLRTNRVATGIEGYRRAFLDAPCAIILDYELPQGNGDYVLRRLKESPATCDIPVIVLTGHSDASIERKMRGLGASEFLSKPFDWDRLRTALQIHLEEFQETTRTAPIENSLS
ncbi:MAG: response regulator [Pirellulales bacterium]